MAELQYYDDLIEFDFDYDALPQAERGIAHSVKINLTMMQQCINNVAHSLNLYQFARQQMTVEPRQSAMFVAWIEAAVRNGAMMANSVHILMEAINKTWHRAPAIWVKADKSQKETATKLFAAEFPDIGSIRKHAAHPAEFMKSEDETAKHAADVDHGAALGFSGPMQFRFLHNAISEVEDGVVLNATFKKKLVTYELSPRKLNALKEVRMRYTSTFLPLEPEWVSQMRAQWSQNGLPSALDRLICGPSWSDGDEQ